MPTYKNKFQKKVIALNSVIKSKKNNSKMNLAKALIESSMDAIFAFDKNMHYTVWNKAMENLTGINAKKIIGYSALDVFPQIKNTPIEAHYKKVLSGEKICVEDQEFTYLTNGEQGFFDANWSPVFDHNGIICGGVTVVRDITQRKQREAEIDRFFNHSIDLLLIAGLDGYFKKINPAFETALGYSLPELTSKPFIEFVHPEDKEKTISEVIALSNGKTTTKFENRYHCKDGSYKWISWKAVPFSDRIYAIGRDMTAQLKAESIISDQQNILINSAKLASLGEMAGGLAHEINNPLAIIVGNIEKVKDLTAEAEIDRNKLNKSITAVEKTTLRIAKIIKGLKLFSRDGKNDPICSANIAEIIAETVSFCGERFKANDIHFDYANATTELFIECRPVQISQVILNLLSNSYDAIENLNSKWVKIQTVDLGEYIKLIISDSGSGIDSKIQEKIMQPFFTTKDVGKGTGLGLSISKGIIESHSGTISLNNSFTNTTFEILLPKKQDKANIKSAV